MEAKKVTAATIRLAAHESQISLDRVHHQLFENLRNVGSRLSCFPFKSFRQECPWPRFGDFRDAHVARLPSSVPLDHQQCITIKNVLTADLKLTRDMFANRTACLDGDDLAAVSSTIADLELRMSSLAERPLSPADMRQYAQLEIKSGIRRMLDDDIARGHLVVHTDEGKATISLDNLVSWAITRKILVEQDELPGCKPLVAASYQRLHRQLSKAALPTLPTTSTAVTSTRDLKGSRPPVPGTVPSTENGKLAVELAWNIETTQNCRATAKEVLDGLMEMATKGVRPDILKARGKDGRSVEWVTSKGDVKNYSYEAVGKTLERWHASRQDGSSGCP